MNEQEKNGITKIASCLQDLRKCIVEKISDKKKGKAICTAKLTEILWQCRNLSICTATINGINGFFHVSAETCLSALPQSKERGGKGGMGGKEGRQHRIGKPGAHLILTKAANAHRCRP